METTNYSEHFNNGSLVNKTSFIFISKGIFYLINWCLRIFKEKDITYVDTNI